MFTEADLVALQRVARPHQRRPGERGPRPRDDEGLRPHRRPARRVADPARRRVADLALLRGARGPGQPVGPRARHRRRRRRPPRRGRRRHRAAPRLRVATPPHQRHRAHARRCRPRRPVGPLRPVPRRRVRRPRVVHLVRAPDERAAARARSSSASSCSRATSSPSTEGASSRRWATRSSSSTRRSRGAAAIALDLVDAMAEDELLPPVRVGLAHGRVVSRLGDVFGLTVNKASRITAVTPSGKVYVDDDMARGARRGLGLPGDRTTPPDAARDRRPHARTNCKERPVGVASPRAEDPA